MKKTKIDWPSRGHNYSKEEIRALGDFLASPNTSLSQSNNVSDFEKKFNKQFKDKSSVALMSAAHAIDLIALKIKSSTKWNYEFLTKAKKDINLVTITRKGGAPFLNSITYFKFSGKQIEYKENDMIVLDDELLVLKSWPYYVI